MFSRAFPFLSTSAARGMVGDRQEMGFSLPLAPGRGRPTRIHHSLRHSSPLRAPLLHRTVRTDRPSDSCNEWPSAWTVLCLVTDHISQ